MREMYCGKQRTAGAWLLNYYIVLGVNLTHVATHVLRTLLAVSFVLGFQSSGSSAIDVVCSKRINIINIIAAAVAASINNYHDALQQSARTTTETFALSFPSQAIFPLI